MGDRSTKSQGTQPPPQSERGHPLPRRTSPEDSVTLRHHQHAREASRLVDYSPKDKIRSSSRNSSGESHDTMRSDPKKWFDNSNKNPQAGYNESSMDGTSDRQQLLGYHNPEANGASSNAVDPPFFQHDRQSSQGFSRSGPYMSHTGSLQVPGRPSITHHSSSADDYRSVIDDLTIENQRLKEELKRYKQFGPGSMKKERLFEVKFHGLHPRKRKELEKTLRHFAASVGASSEATSQRKDSKHHKQSHGSQSKHASSSSSHSRPVDSAYASASIGPTNSSGTSLNRPLASSRAKSSELKVERYLQDIPEGLYPGSFPQEMSVTERERLVVRKLEQLFTGKISGRHFRRSHSHDEEMEGSELTAPQLPEPSREAFIQPQTGELKKNRSRDNLSTNSNSHGETTESGGNGGGSGDGSHNTSPPTIELPEQRPTRLRDLDPNRAQNPTENMDYIRHLGLTAPQLMRKDVLPDPEGWVYLNLLANMSQLHIFNVNLDFIRRSIRDQSTKLQLSSKGDKVRWRGGDKGTKFSSDSSERNSQMSPSTDDDAGAVDDNGQRKRQKISPTEPDRTATFAGKVSTKTGPSGSSESIHYKPIFVQQNSSIETSSGSDAPSYGVPEESNPGNHSRWGLSGSGSTNRRKRKADGAMVFYSGAPFCTDLTRDPGDGSSTTYLSSGQDPSSEDASPRISIGLPRERTMSGSMIPYRPLVDGPVVDSDLMDVDDKVPDLESDDDDEPTDDFPWSDDTDEEDIVVPELVLEPSGVGQVYPDDHFRVLVTTRRPRKAPGDAIDETRPNIQRNWSNETAESVIARLSRLAATSPRVPDPPHAIQPVVEIEYVSGKVRRLDPVPLPPPTRFIGLDSSSDSDSDDLRSWEEEDDDDVNDEEEALDSSVEMVSQRVNPYQSEKTRGNRSDDTSYDDEGSDSVREAVAQIMGQKPRLVVPSISSLPGNSSSSLLGKTLPLPLRRAGSSSVATAGGAESGYISSEEAE